MRGRGSMVVVEALVPLSWVFLGQSLDKLSQNTLIISRCYRSLALPENERVKCLEHPQKLLPQPLLWRGTFLQSHLLVAIALTVLSLGPYLRRQAPPPVRIRQRSASGSWSFLLKMFIVSSLFCSWSGHSSFGTHQAESLFNLNFESELCKLNQLRGLWC